MPRHYDDDDDDDDDEDDDDDDVDDDDDEESRDSRCRGDPDHCSRPEPHRGAAFATGTVATVGPVDGLIFPCWKVGVHRPK